MDPRHKRKQLNRDIYQIQAKHRSDLIWNLMNWNETRIRIKDCFVMKIIDEMIYNAPRKQRKFIAE